MVVAAVFIALVVVGILIAFVVSCPYVCPKCHHRFRGPCIRALFAARDAKHPQKRYVLCHRCRQKVLKEIRKR